MTIKELIVEFHDWPGCEELRDDQIESLIQHFGYTQMVSSKPNPKAEPTLIAAPKFQSS
jgi:hypothetical protein